MLPSDHNFQKGDLFVDFLSSILNRLVYRIQKGESNGRIGTQKKKKGLTFNVCLE